MFSQIAMRLDLTVSRLPLLVLACRERYRRIEEAMRAEQQREQPCVLAPTPG
jgi:ABC-type phosphate transport system permease subunit